MTDRAPKSVSLVLQVAPQDVARLRRHPLLRANTHGRPVTRYLKRRDQASRESALRASGLLSAESGAQVADKPSMDGLHGFEIARTTRQLALADGGRAQLRLDVGMLRGGVGDQPISRLHVALEAGDPRRLMDLVLELQRTVLLRPLTVGEVRRLYLARREERPKAVKPGAVALDPAMTVEAALATVVEACLDHLIANEPVVFDARSSRDAQVEGVHQMRVALRRLRACMTLFGGFLPDAQRAWIQGETRWLAQTLGEARDWDVFLSETVAPVVAVLPAAEALVPATELRRAAAYRAIGDALRSERYRVLLIELLGWIEQAGWRDQPVSAQSALLFQPIGELVGPMLDKRWRRATKGRPQLSALEIEARHDARKDVKKLRYALDFFAELLPGKRVRKLGRALADLQDGLGAFNDAATAQRLGEILMADRAGVSAVERHARATAGGLVIGWHAAVAKAREPDLDRLWRKLIAARPK